MHNQYCCKCGKDLPDGSARYILSIRLYADFDGTVEASEEDQRENDIEELISCLEEMDENDMERDVHQEMAFLLCPQCRDSFCGNPLNRVKSENSNRCSRYGILH